ncbi:MAG: hypothetical protein KDD02_27120 [Phaeodactylibacter sp.]|nr:hypothetical protein [Phaeodactylibacter sp.]MCB9302224.1 hypothetical protein [Lewinellaceae bacterium]HQU61111.1 hypothetical protein [Saprospiraceae bacterium]
MALPLFFEDILPAFAVEGVVNLMEGADPENTAWEKLPQATVIRQGNEAAVLIKWKQDGELCHVLNGYWEIDVLFEQMGRREELYHPREKVAFVQKPGFENFAKLRINTVAMGPGIYDGVVRLLFKNPDGIAIPIAAFGELGMIEIYRAGFPK